MTKQNNNITSTNSTVDNATTTSSTNTTREDRIQQKLNKMDEQGKNFHMVIRRSNNDRTTTTTSFHKEKEKQSKFSTRSNSKEDGPKHVTDNDDDDDEDDYDNEQKLMIQQRRRNSGPRHVTDNDDDDEDDNDDDLKKKQASSKSHRRQPTTVKKRNNKNTVLISKQPKKNNDRGEGPSFIINDEDFYNEDDTTTKAGSTTTTARVEQRRRNSGPRHVTDNDDEDDDEFEDDLKKKQEARSHQPKTTVKCNNKNSQLLLSKQQEKNDDRDGPRFIVDDEDFYNNEEEDTKAAAGSNFTTTARVEQRQSKEKSYFKDEKKNRRRNSGPRHVTDDDDEEEDEVLNKQRGVLYDGAANVATLPDYKDDDDDEYYDCEKPGAYAISLYNDGDDDEDDLEKEEEEDTDVFIEKYHHADVSLQAPQETAAVSAVNENASTNISTENHKRNDNNEDDEGATTLKKKRMMYCVCGIIIIIVIVAVSVYLATTRSSSSPPSPTTSTVAAVSSAAPTLSSSLMPTVSPPPLWEQVGQDIDGLNARDQSGSSVSLSSSGDILLVGAFAANTGRPGTAQVYEFSSSNNVWNKLGQLLVGITTDDEEDLFGYAASISDDGLIFAIGAPNNDGGTGAVYIYNMVDTSSSIKIKQLELLQILHGESQDDLFGVSTVLSGDGSTIVVGANQQLDSDDGPGYVKVYQKNNQNNTYVQVGNMIAGTSPGDKVDVSIAIAHNGSVITTGSRYAEGETGHVQIYHYNQSSNIWDELGNNDNNNNSLLRGDHEGDEFGTAVASSASGEIVAVSAKGGGARRNAGTVKVLKINKTDNTWYQLGDDIDGKEFDVESGGFHQAVSMSDFGTVLAIGSPDSGGYRGSVRIYEYVSNTKQWTQASQDIDGEASNEFSGIAISLNGDGSMVAIGAVHNSDNGFESGHVRVYRRSDA